MKYAFINSRGFVEIGQNYFLPAGAIEVTDTDYGLLSSGHLTIIVTDGQYSIITSPPADPPTPAELAAIAQRQADLIESANAKADATTQYLVSHTILEINNYIRGQINTPAVTNLATATTSLKEMETLLIKLAAVVSILAKDKLR